jgi:hypothetical protein
MIRFGEIESFRKDRVMIRFNVQSSIPFERLRIITVCVPANIQESEEY